VSLKKTESIRNDNSQKAKDIADQQPEKSGSKEGVREIKRLKTARPDMSRARGARPPDIERPTGSRIPRGLGKPGGANIPGRK